MTEKWFQAPNYPEKGKLVLIQPHHGVIAEGVWDDKEQLFQVSSGILRNWEAWMAMPTLPILSDHTLGWRRVNTLPRQYGSYLVLKDSSGVPSEIPPTLYISATQGYTVTLARFGKGDIPRVPSVWRGEYGNLLNVAAWRVLPDPFVA